MRITFSNPKTQWAKNHIKNHGATMDIMNEGMFQGKRAINVRSLGKTSKGELWIGWFTTDDADWTEEKA